MNKIEVAQLRENYLLNELLVSDVLTNPIKQFEVWFKNALDAQVKEPNAMQVSTINRNNRPSNRTVLLKSIENDGFVFYTNYNSNKSAEIEQNPFGAITFLWIDLERQVRIEGKIAKVSAEESNEYFAQRPRGSQIGAWVSNQSEVIESREVLEKSQLFFEKKFENISIPRPEHWGGFKLIPDKIEFWQGRSSRLHDRILYTLEGNDWKIERLSP
jgi:pyridoxamine 5'-phosphate oxidase